MKEAINSDRAPAAIASYSQAVWSGDLLFLSGQIGMDPASGDLVEGGVEAQTRRAMDNLSAVLDAAGLTFDNLIKATIYLTDMSHYGRVNEIYMAYLGEVPPARAAVQVASLPKDALIEIEAIASR